MGLEDALDGDGEIDLGSGFRAEPHRKDGDLVGFWIVGPAAPACPCPYEGRCGGLVRVKDTGDERPVWELRSLDPLHLEPSVQCGCDGQHGWVRGGCWIAC